MPRDLVAAVQRDYPRIYLACHIDHVRAVSTSYRLSAKDSTLLAHLDPDAGMTMGRLARHLGIGAPSLSAAIRRMEALGYVSRSPRPRDRRIIELRLTAQGSEAMASTSLLDTRRVASMLARLPAADRRRATVGLALLARAADKLQLSSPGRAAAKS